MALDFSKPATTDNYSTQFVPNIQANQTALAQWLDSSVVSITGTIPVNAKRYNGTTGALEWWNGSSWATLPLGGAFNGTVGATTPSTGAFTTLAGTTATFTSGASADTNPAFIAIGSSTSQGSVALGAVGYRIAGGSAYGGVDTVVAGATITHASSTGLAVTGALSVSAAAASSTFKLSSVGGSGRDWVQTSKTDGTWTLGSDLLPDQLQLYAGNLGLGATPSAWVSNRKVLAIGGNVVANVNYAASIGENAYNFYYTAGGTPTYQVTAPAAIYDFNNSASGGFAWKIAPSGTAGTAITFTQAMTLDASVLTIAGAVVAAASDSAAGGYGFSGFTDYRIWASTNNLNFRIGGAGTTFQVTNNGAAVTGTLTASKRAYTVSTSVSFSATPSFDANASNFHILGALTANVTSVTITNAQEGQFLTIRFTQDGTGGRTITTGNMGATNAPSIQGAPSTTANKSSYLNLTYNATAARWEGSWLATT